eukprot:CAMPEP_0172764182 /NCGR_PEP_ID=MMETSP1074-20121228/176794_1 /TAXON_ID=2916 /ORGANISM="Ceratium fusus, Strain PA161109" /LENGTH=65 /DNA_ID=CAMNT_0013598905 /DNA_START=106 /DNA_END=303 /DNA_ORIENTATION=-
MYGPSSMDASSFGLPSGGVVEAFDAASSESAGRLLGSVNASVALYDFGLAMHRGVEGACCNAEAV